ncbi:uncharacterized protein LOC125921658 [Panthera uncia]|uniref:uncharacterized protein LOC125921658 n=1 Tax=Panthera uncia TaxID=29064 RepID=UPI0020FFEE06|nr:uncharacterized protein LOC125921658 [Panthera uncia]
MAAMEIKKSKEIPKVSGGFQGPFLGFPEETAEQILPEATWSVNIVLGPSKVFIIVDVIPFILLSVPPEQRERDTSGQAQPQPQQQPPRRHGGARHKERYGDPPRLPPPPGRVAGPRGHPSPPPRTRSARTAGHGAEGGRRGAEEPQGSGARPRGMGVAVGRVLGTPAPAPQPEPGGRDTGLRGEASGRGAGGPRASSSLPPPPASPFPHRAPAPRLRPPVSASSLTLLRPSSLPDLAELHSWPPLSRFGHPPSATPEKPTETAPRPAHRRDLPSLPRRGSPRPRPALLRLLGISPPSPEGSPGGRGRGRSPCSGPFSHRVPHLGPKINKPRPICKSLNGPVDFEKRVLGGGQPVHPWPKPS